MESSEQRERSRETRAHASVEPSPRLVPNLVLEALRIDAPRHATRAGIEHAVRRQTITAIG